MTNIFKNKTKKKTTTRIIVLFLISILMISGIFSLILFRKPAPSAQAAWYTTGGTWNYRKAVTFTADAAKIPLAQADFPALINLTTDAGLAANARNDGYDILFTSSDETTKLSSEIEKFDGGTGKLVAWVKVPSLSTSTIIYMYYGNASATAPTAAEKQAVWSNGYAGVWHLTETNDGNANTDDFFKDSTLNSHDGDDRVSATGKTGKIYNGQQFDGSDGIELGNPLNLQITGQITISTWAYSTGDGYEAIVHKGGAGGHMYCLWRKDGPDWDFRITGGNRDLVGGTPAASWKYVVATYNGSYLRLYEDTTEVDFVGDTSALTDTSSGDIGIGRRMGTYPDYWNGYLDEVRISNVARTAEWIATEYASQNDPGSFYSLAGEEIGDMVAPSNPTDIDGYSTSGKVTPIISGNFYNYPTPYFEWPAAEAVGGAHDTGNTFVSGVAGYYSYFDTNCSADPTITRGVLSQVGEAGLHYSADTNVTVPDLTTNDGTYCLRIKTKDNAGNVQGTALTAFTYKYDSTAPDAPSYIAANPAGYTAVNSFDFSWPAASDNVGGSGLAGYQYTRGAGSGDSWSATQVGTSVSSVQAYQGGENIFLVRSVDIAGNYSSTVQTTYYYSASAPKWSKPTDLTAIPAINDVNSFAFSWTAPSHPQAIVDYGYSINAYPTNLNLTWTGSSSTSLTAGPYATIQGENTFYIVAKDEGGNYALDADNVDSVVFNCQTAAPPIPVSVSVTDSSNRVINLWALTLKWSAGAGQDPATFNHYSVLRSTNGVDFSEFATTASTAYIDATGLNNTTTYYYRIRAYDNAGSGSAPSSVVSKIPTGRYSTPPTIVSGPDVVIKASEATVSWVSSRISTSSIRFGASEGDLSRSQIDPVAKTSHSITVVGLNPGTKYYYQVQSLDEYRDYSSESAYSSTYSFSTLTAPSIANVTVSNITLTNTDVSWETSTPANMVLNYGTSVSYGDAISEASGSYTTNHSVTLSNLTHTTKYHFKISGADIDGNILSSDDYVFDTLPMPTISSLQYQPDFSGPAPVMVITWLTNVPTTSSVKYAPVSASDVISFEENQSELVVQHKVSLSNLKDNTDYRLTVSGTDQFGNTVTSSEQIFKTNMDTRPPKISDIVIETSNVGLGKTDSVQISVSWKTDELATSQVEYNEGLGGDIYTKKTQGDKTLTNSHLVIISGLKPGAPYHLRVVSADEAGNIANSPDNTVISGAVPKSILQLIIQILNQIFGWIGKWL